jgi:hypothetical protein
MEVGFPLMGPSDVEEEEDDEDDEEELDWRGALEELKDYFAANTPGSEVDSAGLFGAQQEAFGASVAQVESGEDFTEACVQTVRNLVDLTAHLLVKCSATENELLAAVRRLEERRERHVELKKKLSGVTAELKRVERENEAYKLRAERSEMKGKLHEEEASSLREELNKASQQLEEMKQSEKIGPKEEEILNQLTLRGRGVSAKLDEAKTRVNMNVAALTAELEALELSPRTPAQTVSESAGEESDSALRTPRRTEGSGRYLQLVNELVNDNDLLQKEYLLLLDAYRKQKSLPPHSERTETAMLRAARQKAELTLQQCLKDKVLLEQALTSAVRKA